MHSYHTTRFSGEFEIEAVLILVLMEDALVLSGKLRKHSAVDVLILVLMEDALVLCLL